MNIFSIFKAELIIALLSLIILSVGLVLGSVAIAGIGFIIMFIAGTMVLVKALTLKKYNYPFFNKQTVVLKNVRVYIPHKEGVMFYATAPEVEWDGNLGYIHNMHKIVKIERQHVLHGTNGNTTNIVLFGDTGISVGEETVITAKQKGVKVLDALDEHFYKKKAEYLLEGLKTFIKEKETLVNKKNSLLESITSPSILITFAFSIFVISLVFSSKMIADASNKASALIEANKDLHESLKILSTALQTSEEKNYVALNIIANKIGVSLPSQQQQNKTLPIPFGG